jgi:pectate lyase
MVSTKLGLIFCVSFAVLIPSLWANIAEFDDYWQQRADEAKKAALEAYHPNPEEVTEQINTHVNE